MGFVASFSNGVDLSAPLHVALYLSQLASYIFLSSVSSYILLVACSLLCSIYIEMYLTGENPCFAVDRQQIHWFNEQQSPLPVTGNQCLCRWRKKRRQRHWHLKFPLSLNIHKINFPLSVFNLFVRTRRRNMTKVKPWVRVHASMSFQSQARVSEGPGVGMPAVGWICLQLGKLHLLASSFAC